MPPLRLLAAFAVAALLPLRAQAAPAACQTVEIRGVAADGDRIVTDAEGQSVHLAAAPIAVAADLSHAYVNLTEGKIALNVTLSPAAAHRMRDYTAAHVGQGIAYIVDDHAVQVLRVRDPVLASGILIGGISKAEADRVAAGINARLPACS
jgi:preprotein translocase subunit SecD